MATDGYILMRAKLGKDFSEPFLDKLRDAIGNDIGGIAYCEDFDDVEAQREFFEGEAE